MIEIKMMTIACDGDSGGLHGDLDGHSRGGLYSLSVLDSIGGLDSLCGLHGDGWEAAARHCWSIGGSLAGKLTASLSNYPKYFQIPHLSQIFSHSLFSAEHNLHTCGFILWLNNDDISRRHKQK